MGDAGVCVSAGASECVDCSICLSRAKHPSILKQCGHAYCSGCIKEWLKAHEVCPQCRAKSSLESVVAVKGVSAKEVIAKEKKRLSNYETKLPLRQHDLEKATKELEMLTREFDMLSKDELQI